MLLQVGGGWWRWWRFWKVWGENSSGENAAPRCDETDTIITNPVKAPVGVSRIDLCVCVCVCAAEVSVYNGTDRVHQPLITSALSSSTHTHTSYLQMLLSQQFYRWRKRHFALIKLRLNAYYLCQCENMRSWNGLHPQCTARLLNVNLIGRIPGWTFSLVL